MDRNKFIPTENQLHPVHLVCAEGMYVPRYLHVPRYSCTLHVVDVVHACSSIHVQLYGTSTI